MAETTVDCHGHGTCATGAWRGSKSSMAGCPVLAGLLLLAIAWLPGTAWGGLPPLQRFEFGELQAYYQNREVHPLADGEVWVVGPSGLLRFDGSRWRLTETPGSLLGLAREASGEHCAQDSRILRFSLTEDGSLAFRALKPLGPRETPSPLAVLHHAGACVVIGSHAIWRSSADDDWQRFDLAEAVDKVPGRVWPPLLRQGGRLLRLSLSDSGPLLEPIESELSARDLVAWVDLADGAALQVDASGAIHRWQAGSAHAWAQALWPQLAQLRPTAARLAVDGSLLLGFAQGGVWVLDADGRLVEVYGEAEGLPELRVNHLAEDEQRGLWVALMRYVVRIDRGAGATLFDRHSGLQNATAFARHRGELVVGTHAGLRRMIEPALPERVRFEPIEGSLAQIFDLVDHGDWLWVAHDNGLMRLRLAPDGRTEQREVLFEGGAIHNLQLARFAPDRLYAAGRRGLHRIDQAGTASPQLRWIDGAPSGARVVDESATSVWMAGAPQAFIHVDWSSGSTQVRRYDMEAAGVRGRIKVVPRTEGALSFLGSTGVLRFDAEREAFVPDRSLLGDDADASAVYQLMEDAQGNLWAAGGGFIGAYWREGEGYRRDGTVLRGFDPQATVHAFARFGDELWVARSDGALRLDLARRRPPPAAALPRLVGIVDTRSGERMALPSVGHSLALDQGGADLRFEFALPLAADASRVLLRSRLLGYDTEFSDWSRSIDRSYTNLPHGRFRFEVEATDPYARQTAMTPLPIDIAAPWYLRPAGIGGLAVLGLLALIGSARAGARWRTRRLLQRQAELETEVAQRTAELAASNLRLEEQAARLREIDELKSRLFDNVSHEFRTPLTLVLGPLDDVLSDLRQRLSERSRDLLEMARRNARKVLDLIVELMDLHRIEQGQLPMRPQRVELRGWLARQQEDLQALAERHGHQMQAQIELAPGLQASLDPVQIERCLQNLVGNAAKYTPRGGCIELLAHGHPGDPERIRIEVRDNGIGIAAAELAHVFDRYYQARRSASGDGAGIGLALVREIVEAHGGAIGVDSRPGEGSCFRIDLPLGLAGREAVAPEGGSAISGDPGPTPADTEAEVETDQRPQVLVVDDHEELRQRLRDLLGARYRVLLAADGEPALALARRELPDAIVCDVMMPGMDGLSFARRLRADPDTAPIPLLLLTARAGAAQAVAGLSAGADDYLCKPFDAGELGARIEAMLNQRRRLCFALQRQQRPPVALPNAEERWRERVEAVVEARLGESDFGVDALAEAVHADRTTLFRRLKTQLGMSPSELIREARLKRAHGLLESGAGNVTEVAYAVGFESLSSFARAFRARFGCAPSALQAVRAADGTDR